MEGAKVLVFDPEDGVFKVDAIENNVRICDSEAIKLLTSKIESSRYYMTSEHNNMNKILYVTSKFCITVIGFARPFSDLKNQVVMSIKTQNKEKEFENIFGPYVIFITDASMTKMYSVDWYMAHIMLKNSRIDVISTSKNGEGKIDFRRMIRANIEPLIEYIKSV